jgi:hypothetical protein
MRFALPCTADPRPPARRLLAAGACMAMTFGTVAALGSSPAHAAATAATISATSGGFTAGDVVVYRVGDGSSALSSSGTPIFLDEYSPTGSLLASQALPTTADGADKAIVASGSATSEGGLTLSADGRYLVATGYDAAVGTAGLSSSAAANVPRTIARVDAAGDVDTTTALTDFADGNNPRSAVSQDGSEFWVGGAAGGVRYATLGAATSTSLVSSTYKNVRQLEIADGQLYASADPTKASVTVASVGSGLPTSGTQAVTDLPFASPPIEPYAYSLLTLGSGTTPDTLYVADNSAGAVVKYGLSGGTWVQEGSVAVANVTGLTADDSGGTVTLYATSSGSSGTAGTLYKIVDASGIGGTLTGGAAVLAFAPANEAFRGVVYAPGTVIGSGGGTAPTGVSPTISTAHSGLPAALGDPTNPALSVTVGDPDFAANQLSVTTASSNPAVAPPAGITVTGSGADLTLAVTPASIGYCTITLTVTAPDGTSASTQVQYGASANLGDASQRYFTGAGNGSTAVDVGDGYMIVGDDLSNVLHLYNETQSGPPVASFDFTSELPEGTSSIDIEASARSGDLLYWTGSMGNSSSGTVEPSRSTLFAARITGSGADTQLTYVGSYSGLKDDLVAWDEDNGSGLGANYFGFAQSTEAGVDSHDADALNVEGMEFAGSSSSTAYLAFRAPLEPTTDRELALIVPVTNIDQLVTGAATGATFGAPILMNLGGLGIREIRENADGQYLIIAGTADDTNNSFVLYSWDGNPADPPLPTGTALPLEPAGADQGAWESIVSVPDPLAAGDGIQLLEDNGDTAWYGDTLTSKTGLNPDLEKDLGQVFSYVPATPLTTNTTLAVAPSGTAVQGSPVTLTATESPATTGTVQFLDGTAALGAPVPVSDGVASLTTTVLTTGTHDLSAAFTSSDSTYAASGSAPVPLTETAIGIDQTITANGASTVTTPVFGTSGPRLLVAFTSSAADNAKQATTVTGAGLTWTLAQSAKAKSGTAEIWTAYAPGPLTNVSVTATPTTPGFDQSLTVVAFTGASGIGAGVTADSAKSVPSVTLTTTTPGSWVFGVGEAGDATTRVLGPDQTLVNQQVDASGPNTFWVQSQTARTLVAGTQVTIDDTAPTSALWCLAAVEILPTAS